MTADGKSVVGHVGARLLSDLADEVGLTEGSPDAMAPTKMRTRGQGRGQVLVDLAVMLADDGETSSESQKRATTAGPPSALVEKMKQSGAGSTPASEARCAHRPR